MDESQRLKRMCVWLTASGAVSGAFIVMFLVYPPAPRWGSSVYWGDLSSWLGSLATLSATGAALWLAGRERFRSHQEAKRKGEIALARALPEISRLTVAFEHLDATYKKLLQGSTEQHLYEELDSTRKYMRSWLDNVDVNIFVDMPEHLALTLPTAIGALPLVRDGVAGIVKDRLDIERLKHAQEFARACSVEFRAAAAYFDKHISPRQLNHMNQFLAEEAESQRAQAAK